MSDLDHENIDFKPLSEGLGFHQKKQRSGQTSSSESVQAFGKTSQNQLEDQAADNQTAKNQASFEVGEDLSKNFNEDEKQSLTPIWMRPSEDRHNSWAGDLDIGRQPSDDGVVDGGLENSTVIENPFYIPQKISSPVEVVTLKFSGHDGLRRPQVKPITGSLTAILMDTLTLISLSMILLTVVFAIQGKSSSEAFMQMSSDGSLRSSLSGLVLSMGFMYLVLARCFFGRTLGEWMMHLQLGSSEDQEQNIYPIKVLVRTFFVFFSGFVIFPIISWMADRDILSYFSGIEMHKEVKKS